MRCFTLFVVLILQSQLALADPPRMLFDQGHRQAFVIEKDGPLQLRGMATVFQQQGWQVNSSTGELTSQELDKVDALIISGAFAPLSESEIDAVLAYLKRGGNLAIMIHIGQPLGSLIHHLGVEIGNLVIHENQHQPDGNTINFTVSALKQHPLTKGLKQFSIYGGWPLRSFSREGETIASSSPHSWVDVNLDRQLSKGDLISPFAVLISGTYGRGSFAVFADDAIFQNQFLRDDNKLLAENLGRWLKTGGKQLVEI